MKLARSLLNEMIAHARKEAPLECCGVLIGSQGTVEEVRACHNERQSRSEFSIPPRELFDLFRELRETGRELLGVYHSHPQTHAYPSEKDRENFHYPDASYWVISLSDPQPVVRCFRWTGHNGFDEVKVSIEETK